MRKLHSRVRVTLAVGLFLFFSAMTFDMLFWSAESESSITGYPKPTIKNPMKSPIPAAVKGPLTGIRSNRTHRRYFLAIAFGGRNLFNCICTNERETVLFVTSYPKRLQMVFHPTPGNVSDYFAMEKFLGSGGYGDVYLGRSIDDSSFAAIKAADLEKDSSATAHLTLEAIFLSHLDHPNIIKYLHSFVERNPRRPKWAREWLALEYMDGGSLHYLLKGDFGRTLHLSYSEIAYLIREVLKALDLLHSNGFFHRDIKMKNVLVDTKGNVKLTDFGFAQVIEWGEERMNFPGTNLWKAPELLRRESYGSAVDIWSLGITVHQALNGRPPYSNLKPADAIEKIKVEGVPPLAPSSDPLFPQLNDFVQRCLKMNPLERATAAELLEISSFLIFTDFEHPFLLSAVSKEEFARTIIAAVMESDHSDDF